MPLQFREPFQIQQAKHPLQALADTLGPTLQTLPSLWAAYKLKRQEQEAQLAQQKAEHGSSNMPIGLGRVLGDLPGVSPTPQESEAMSPVQQLKAFGERGMSALKMPSPPSARGAVQQTSYVDSSDGTPLFFDRDNQRYVRSDETPLRGMPVPSKGQGEATQSASRAAEILPKIDTLFDALKEKNEASARASTMPVVGPVFYPEINQLKNEVKQVGFTFGGKNFTGTEEAIITDALIPKWNDNDASREAKRKALKGYISGQIDLMGAANLLGPAGARIKEVIQSGKQQQPQGGVPAVGQTYNGQKVLNVRRKQ